MSVALMLRAGWERGHRVHPVDPVPVPILQTILSAQLPGLTLTAACLEVSKAPVRCHTLWQPAPPGTVRPIFPCRRLDCLASCELHSQPGRKAVPGDFFSGAVSLELGRTSGAQLTGEDKTTWRNAVHRRQGKRASCREK